MEASPETLPAAPEGAQEPALDQAWAPFLEVLVEPEAQGLPTEVAEDWERCWVDRRDLVKDPSPESWELRVLV